MDNDTFGCIVYVAMFAIVLAISLFFESISCGSKFPGMQTSWGPIKGCLVNTPQGWIPAENYRVM